MSTHTRTLLAGMASLAMSLSALSPVFAAEAAATDQQTWRDECGSCHIAYPPRLLPKSAWAAMMRTLDDHFGTDASLDAATAASIGRYLAAAGNTREPPAGSDINLRVTKTRWFVHEHDEVPAAKWRSPAVKSPSNCSACHRQAEQGRFDEKSIRVPK